MPALRQAVGLRQHHARYNIDEATRRRLKVAFTTLHSHRDALEVAIGEVAKDALVDHPTHAAALVRRALHVLAHGQNGEFR